MPASHYLIRYAEIALKGKNRSFFENRLLRNIATAISTKHHLQPTLHRLHSQILLTLSSPHPLPDLTPILSHTFGIAWFAPVTLSSTALPDLTHHTLALVASLAPTPSTTFAIRVTRHHKAYPLTSRQIEIKIGSAVASQFSLKVDLTHPDLTISIDILKDQAFLYSHKLPGPGGLPVGTAGKALCLLSGGFDSVAAAYLAAKRGLQVDFLHFHVFANPKHLKTTKIWPIATHLAPLVGAHTLYAAAYTPFQVKLLNLSPQYRSQELILFRRFMFRTAAQLARQHGYQALVSGDSLGQVASQTLSNLTAVDQALLALFSTTSSPIPLFRPLISFDKKDIIDLVKQIGLYDQVIKPYKDCCSLVATHPATHAHLPLINRLEQDLSLLSLSPTITPLSFTPTPQSQSQSK